MDIKEFISKFVDELDETSIDEVTAETDYKALPDWSSLTALSVIAMIDDEYGKEVTGDDLRRCVTIEQLFDFVTA